MDNTEHLERFAAQHGIPALLDHLGLDELANHINELHQQLAQAQNQAAFWRKTWIDDVSPDAESLAHVDAQAHSEALGTKSD